MNQDSVCELPLLYEDILSHVFHHPKSRDKMTIENLSLDKDSTLESKACALKSFRSSERNLFCSDMTGLSINFFTYTSKCFGI